MYMAVSSGSMGMAMVAFGLGVWVVLDLMR